MKYVLITGVAGLLGSRFAEYILETTDYGVVGIDNMFGGYAENLPASVDDRFVFSKMDVESSNLEYIFKTYQPEYVFHFAAYAAEGLSHYVRMFNYKNNMLSTANVVNCCINYGVKRLVYTSSMSVYGKGDHPGVRFDEDMTPMPEDPYAISKYACEKDIECAGVTHNLDWCIIRPHNVYGVNQNIWDRYRNVLGIWMYQRLNGEPLTIYGDGLQTRAFSYIDDTLPCLWNAAVLPGASRQIINVGGMKAYTIRDACNIVASVVGADRIINLEERYEVRHAVPTYQKSIDVLGYDETTDLYEGVTKMWAWAQMQPNRQRFKWPFYEIDKGIYSYWK